MATQFDKFDVMKATLGADLATNGTVVFTYPTKSPARAAASYAAAGAVFIAAQGAEAQYLQQALGFSLVYGATTVTLTYLGLTTIPNGTVISLQAPVAAYDAVTDSSTGAIVAAIAAGVGDFTLALPVDLTSLTTLALDLVTAYVPGFKFKLLSATYAVNKIATGAGATQAINPAITGVAVTGGVVTPTLANAAVMGALVAGTAITALNTGTAADSISVKVAAGGVVFTAGSGVLLIKIQNMDVADAFATLTAKLAAYAAVLNAREITPQTPVN